MRTLSRALTAFAVSTLLVLAPLSATAAFGDDEPVITEAPTVVDGPSDFEALVAEDPAVDETPADEAVERLAPEAVIEPEAAASRAEPAPAGRAVSGVVSPSIELEFMGGEPVDLIVVGYVLTASWSPDGETGTGYLEDRTGDSWVTNQSGIASFTAALIPGHAYELGFASGSQSVFVQFLFAPLPAPNSAENLAVTRLTSANGWALSWNVPANNTDNPVTNYEIEVSDGSSSVFHDTTNLNYVADGLITGKTYTFGIVAESADGQRANGTISGGRLVSAVAPTAPTIPVLALTGRYFTATWAAPTYNGGSAISDYRMTLFGNNVQVETTLFNATSVSFHALAQIGVTYEVRVSAINGPVGSQLEGPITTTNTVVGADVAPGAPTVTSGGSSGYQSPTVFGSWTLDQAFGARIASFTVLLRSPDGTIVRQETVANLPNVDRLGYTFTNLPNDTDYTFSVIAVKTAGSSPESNRLAVSTNGAVPPAHTEEQVAASTEFIPAGSVTVTRDGEVLTAHIAGANVGDWVFGYAYSTPTPLGWVQVGAGNLARWNIAGAGLPSGGHTLVVLSNGGGIVGSAPFSIPLAAPLPVVAAAALAVTGTDSPLWIAVGAGILGLGAVLMVRRRVRS